MFVLPPPPRYPTQVAYAAAAANGMAVPTIETNNLLSHPEGPEHRFQVGEGTYVLKNSLHLATPPPHPSEAPIINTNPLAVTPTPPTSGVKVSLCIIQPKKPAPQLYKVTTSTTLGSDRRPYSIKESEKESRLSADNASDEGAGNLSVDGSLPSTSAPAFGEGNIALGPAGTKDGLKRRKPKNNIIKSNSSFVSRVIPHETLAKRISDRDPAGIFAFANINRAYQWLDLTSNIMAEPMAKILFTKAHVLTHDVNELTKSTSHLDVAMGTSAGDIIWYEPISQKYARINKNGVINASPVSKISWVPGSENLFLAAHFDGHLVVYDKEKEDAAFIPEEGAQPDRERQEGEHTRLNVVKSVNSKIQKTNPVAVWKICNQRVNSFAFSPDCRHLAVVSEDGCLRIIDYLQEKLLDIYSGYYGGIICVTWSPDGKYIVTGGQDDLVSIWSFSERQIIARCQGHHSWVTSVAFDPWRCDERNYRFGSVGEDGKLLLWDFSFGMLHRPKNAVAKVRGSISSTLQRHRTTESSVTNRLRSDSSRTQPYAPGDMNGDSQEIGVNHPVEPRARTAQLPPVMVRFIFRFL